MNFLFPENKLQSAPSDYCIKHDHIFRVIEMRHFLEKKILSVHFPVSNCKGMRWPGCDALMVLVIGTKGAFQIHIRWQLLMSKESGE